MAELTEGAPRRVRRRMRAWKGPAFGLVLMTGAMLAVAGPASGAPACVGGTTAGGWSIECGADGTSAVLTKSYATAALANEDHDSVSCSEAMVGSALDASRDAGPAAPAGVEVDSVQDAVGVAATGIPAAEDPAFVSSDAVGPLTPAEDDSGDATVSDVQVGVKDVTVTNWSKEPVDVTVIVHCTSDPTQWTR